MKLTFSFVLVLLSVYAHAQNTLTVTVRDGATDEALPGASVQVEGSDRGAAADKTGNAILKDLPNGSLVLKASFVGYRDTVVTVNVPAMQNLTIGLSAVEEELEEIIVSSTRTN